MRLCPLLVVAAALAILTTPAFAGTYCEFQFAGEDDYSEKKFSGKISFKIQWNSGDSSWDAVDIAGRVYYDGDGVSGLNTYDLDVGTSDSGFGFVEGSPKPDEMKFVHKASGTDYSVLLRFLFEDDDGIALSGVPSDPSDVCGLIQDPNWDTLTATFEYKDLSPTAGDGVIAKFDGPCQVVPLPAAGIAGLALLAALGLARRLRRRA